MHRSKDAIKWRLVCIKDDTIKYALFSGAENLISHAIDEYFPEKSTIHCLQVGWMPLIIEKKYSKKESMVNELNKFYDSIGLNKVLEECIPWKIEEFENLIPYAKKIRNRYTIFNT